MIKGQDVGIKIKEGKPLGFPSADELIEYSESGEDKKIYRYENKISILEDEYCEKTEDYAREIRNGILFPKFTVAVQNLKSLFSGKGQTNEADNSVESVAFPKEQEENITKTDKNVKEAQESTWAKSGQQKQGDSFDFETSKTINETMDYLRKELREVEERLKDTDCTAEEKQRLEAHKQGLRETYETFESANKKLSSLRTTKSKNKRAEASKEVEVNEETQEEDPAVARRNVMEENEKKNNTLGNVNSSGKKSRRSL